MKYLLDIVSNARYLSVVNSTEHAVTKAEFPALWAKAKQAAREAGSQCQPTPMIVGSPSTPFGTDVDPRQPTYFVASGVCGFAWVNIKPGTSAFAKWLKAKGYARSDSYYGGVTVSISEYGQSMERKEAAAHAMAAVLREAGINANAMSRMD